MFSARILENPPVFNHEKRAAAEHFLNTQRGQGSRSILQFMQEATERRRVEQAKIETEQARLKTQSRKEAVWSRLQGAFQKNNFTRPSLQSIPESKALDFQA